MGSGEHDQRSLEVDVHEDNDNDEEEDDDEEFESMDSLPVLIEPGLYIGSFLSEGNKEALQKENITHVLQVVEGMTPTHPDEFSYRTIHVQDVPSEDLVAHFPKCFEFIDAAKAGGGGVLVHCMAGVSRSSTVCIGYLMWKHRISFDEAFRLVHRVRPWIMPNQGFKKQLLEFQKLDLDLTKWRAWRHVVPEDPFTVHLDRLEQAEMNRRNCIF